MSEVKFNLVDSQSILVGTVHGSIGDLCVAALAAEPETIAELETALQRFDPNPPNFKAPYCFSDYPAIDEQPYDAGILIIDLAARVIVCNSTYSLPAPQGKVEIHDAQQDTEIPVFYSLPNDWLFLNEVECYQWARAEQLGKRSPPLDARAILYGRPLLEFLATNLRYGAACCGDCDALSPAGAIHAQWLLTPRADLRGQSPREVMLAKLRFIDQDLEFRAFQWSLQLEGPPCLPKESHAYRYAGFGIHEWIIYYYLIRHLIENADPKACNADFDFAALVTQLDQLKTDWLNNPSAEFDNRIPAIIIDNERKRLPEAMGGRSMVIDEDCPLCKLMGDECEAGRDVCFWHLDGCNMENHFAFSTFLTEQEYVEERQEMQDYSRRMDQQMMKEQDKHIARGEPDDSRTGGVAIVH